MVSATQFSSNFYRVVAIASVVLIVVQSPSAGQQYYSPIRRNYRQPVITYPRGASNDRDLAVCSVNMACNLLHRRFFFTNIVVRLCRCPNTLQCPWDWHDSCNHTMYINSRAQLKFCDKVTDLPACSSKKDALTTLFKRTEVQDTNEVTSSCYCPKMRYLDRSDRVVRHDGNKTETSQTYKCKRLVKCHTGDFCGHITANYFQTYHVCSCPNDHMCLITNKEKNRVLEPLYEDEAYRGTCVSHNQR